MSMRRLGFAPGLIAFALLSSSAANAQGVGMSMGNPGTPPSSYGGMGQPPANMMGSVPTTVHRDAVGRPAYPIRYFDTDTNGVRFAHGEVLAISPSDASFAIIRAQGFTILGSDSLDSLGINLVVLQPPSGMKAADGVAALRVADPSGR